jgi:hypothetical protein
MSTSTALVDWNALANGSVLSAPLIARAVERARRESDIAYTQEVRYFDFDGHGKPFTQVALVLEPERPMTVNGRRVVLATSEGGSDNGCAFIHDNAGNEGLGPWLARRGITFIQLCRLGRWNFLTDKPLGSWRDVPLSGRMPVFNRQQRRHWSPEDYQRISAEGVSSQTNSESCRIPRAGSELEQYMIALTPDTSIKGFELALRALIPAEARRTALVLYNGFSTGGAFMWPLAKRLRPDGIVGYGMSNFPIAKCFSRSMQGKYDFLYDRSAARLRERGTRDFEFYNRELGDTERNRLWENALHHPRFKSHEDTFMFFNVAALAECVSRLWNGSHLPPDERRAGFAALMQQNLDLCFPGEALASVRVLDLYGTRDEVLPPDVARSVESVVGPYCGSYRMAFLEGYHHSITSDHVEAYGSLWLDAIRSNYCLAAAP